MGTGDERGVSRRLALLGAGAVGGVAAAWAFKIGPFDNPARVAPPGGGGGGSTETTTRNSQTTESQRSDSDPIATDTPTSTPTPTPTPENPTFEYDGVPIVVVKNVFGQRVQVVGFVPNLVDGLLDSNFDLRNVGDEPISTLFVEGVTVDQDGNQLDQNLDQLPELAAGSEGRVDPQLRWSDAVAGVRIRLLDDAG